MLLTMLYAVYVDTVDEKRIVAIPAFRSLLETATTREGSDIVLVHDDEEDERNGGVEPQKAGQPAPDGKEAGLLRVRRGDVGSYEAIDSRFSAQISIPVTAKLEGRIS